MMEDVLKTMSLQDKKQLLKSLQHDLNNGCYAQGKLTELINKIHTLKKDIDGKNTK